ncbi:MAG: hypothetical protein O3A87_05865, partial [Verrucomicrobia bacterium]|nr:hypothetical protein [Verrucomicrobiota bacterium]
MHITTALTYKRRSSRSFAPFEEKSFGIPILADIDGLFRIPIQEHRPLDELPPSAKNTASRPFLGLRLREIKLGYLHG